jgi:REP element-mobilizing transposase RayT
MARARKELISLTDTRYYHCIARCVRRAFLCGRDEFSGKDYEHRRQWIVDRLFELADIFAIDVVAYSVLSNHYHTILQINSEQATEWSVDEVIARWTRLFSGHPLVQRYQNGEQLDAALLQTVSGFAEEWRERLSSVSWFMRCLNEHIAREANAEDHCTGRFWEGRFKSQALLDEAALLTCMCYVDLNPVRAGLTESPESSDFTSVQERIANRRTPVQQKRLVPLIGNERQHADPDGIHFHTDDYLALVDWTGRAIRDDKRGSIPDQLPPILQRLQIDPSAWCDGVTYFGSRFPRLAGRVDQLERAVSRLGQRWCQGMAPARRLFVT